VFDGKELNICVRFYIYMCNITKKIKNSWQRTDIQVVSIDACGVLCRRDSAPRVRQRSRQRGDEADDATPHVSVRCDGRVDLVVYLVYL
jgi:hypothetical protein